MRGIGATLALALSNAVAAQTVDPAEAALRILSRSVTPQRDGSHLSLLFALRQLHDPDLKPYFERLLRSSHWQIQVHAALGLAESDSTRQIDPAILHKLAPPAQDAVIATALDLELLPHDRIADALQSEDLKPMARLVLLAELISPPPTVQINSQPDLELVRTQLRALTQADDEHVAGLSASLLAQLGESSSFEAFCSRMAAMETRRATDLQLWLLDAIRRYRLNACGEWVKQLLSAADPASDVAFRAVFTLLELDPPSGIAAWSRLIGDQPAYPRRVKYCSVLLAASSPVPPAMFDRLASNPPNPDEELIARMIAVGKAISASASVPDALIPLLDLGHAKTSDWAMEHTAKLPPAQAAKVYAYLLDRLESPKPSGEAISLAVSATPKLFAIDPDQVLSRLQRAEDDGVLQQAILLGLFEADSPEIGAAATSLRRIGSGRADSLALLQMARHANSMDRGDVDQLGKIAAGGGGLSEVLQIQAAWLYIKFTGQTARALTHLFPSTN